VKKQVVVVGAGYFAQFHVDGWLCAGAHVAAICDIDPVKARAMAERYRVERWFSDAVQMITEIQPDIVDVVLPQGAQADVVRFALSRQIPTICQKPFGVDMTEAQLLTLEAQRNKTPLIIHENFRFSPWFRECRRLIDQGHFGRVHGIAFRLRTGDGQGTQAYLERQPYFQLLPRFLIRETGVHYVDTFRYLLGDVVAVTARLRQLNPNIAGEDSGLVIFEFEDDRTGLFDGNRLNDHPADNPRHTMGEMWLEGEKGVMRLDGLARLWWKPHHGPETEHAYASGERGPFGGACAALQAHVLRHLNDGHPLENEASSYLDVLYVEEAIYQSHASGCRVALAKVQSKPLQ
jgi:predicted dehydrogenase